MSFPINDPAADDNSSGQGESFTGNINPAWNEVLNEIPQEHHSRLLPHLDKWDKGVQERFNSVPSKYSPYDVFVENRISPDALRMSYGLYQAIQNKPLEVIRAMKESMGLDLSELIDQGQIEDPTDDVTYANLPPDVQAKLAEMERQQNIVAQILVTNHQEQLKKQQEQQLENELAQLRQKHGDFDEEFVLNHMLNGMSSEQAVQRYIQLVNNIRESANPRPKPPMLLGSGSTIPDQQNVNPRNLDPKQTRNLVAEYLRSQFGNQG